MALLSKFTLVLWKCMWILGLGMAWHAAWQCTAVVKDLVLQGKTRANIGKRRYSYWILVDEHSQ